MDISIFEDQTGLKLYPDKKADKDNRIVSFFNNNIDLYIEKLGNNLIAYCHLIAYRASSRPLGYFIVYKDNYKDNFFTNLKKDVDKVISQLDLKPRADHLDNLIFENIQKFDDRYQYGKEDTDAVIYSINRGRNLGYSTNNIREISSFSNYILRNINNVKISIASSENELGNINFLIDKKDGETLKKTAKTIQAISESKGMLVEKKKSEIAESGRVKINEGIIKIKEGSDVLKNAGYSDVDIIKEIDKKLNDFVPIYRKKMYETGEKSKGIEIIEKEPAEKKSNPYIKAILIFFGILVIATVVMYFLNPTVMNEKLHSIKEKFSPPAKITPSPTPIPTIPIPTPTKIIPIVTTVAPNTTVAHNTSTTTTPTPKVSSNTP